MPLGVEVTAEGYEHSVTAQGAEDVGLRIDGVTVRFGGLTALDDVSLEVSPGEVVGVIGPNGAGKTTLFNVICGFVRAVAGTVSWRGEALDRVRPHDLAGHGIARTLQGVGLFAGLTAVENVMVGAERAARAGVFSALLGLPRSDRDERRLRELALAALADLGVADVADRLPGTLPFGIQKRVALARALVGVSFTVPDGSITAVLGANGAGKTSLLRTISGVVRARAGRIALEGRDISRMAVEEIVRLGLAHVPEGRGVIAELSVEENLRLGGLWRRAGPERQGPPGGSGP